jgi:hypothetical protein
MATWRSVMHQCILPVTLLRESEVSYFDALTGCAKLYQRVAWPSWLRRNANNVKIPGSIPGVTLLSLYSIYVLLRCLCFVVSIDLFYCRYCNNLKTWALFTANFGTYLQRSIGCSCRPYYSQGAGHCTGRVPTGVCNLWRGGYASTALGIFIEGWWDSSLDQQLCMSL